MYLVQGVGNPQYYAYGCRLLLLDVRAGLLFSNVHDHQARRIRNSTEHRETGVEEGFQEPESRKLATSTRRLKAPEFVRAIRSGMLNI